LKGEGWGEGESKDVAINYKVGEQVEYLIEVSI